MGHLNSQLFTDFSPTQARCDTGSGNWHIFSSREMASSGKTTNTNKRRPLIYLKVHITRDRVTRTPPKSGVKSSAPEG
jgi:hypothetical protein